jgi:RNA 3'-terminal phosphate cyclase
MLLGGTGLGKPRSPANQVGQEAADELIESCSRKVCLDQYAQDQVSFIIFYLFCLDAERFHNLMIA